MFTSGRTVLQEALDTRRNHSEQTVRSVLSDLFSFEMMPFSRKMDVLSGGEKSRLGLATTVARSAQFVVDG